MSSTMHSLLIAKGGWAGYRVGGLGRGVGLIADSALYFWHSHSALQGLLILQLLHLYCTLSRLSPVCVS